MGPLRVVTSWLGSAVQKYPYLLTYLIRWRKSEYNFLLSGTTANKLHFTDAIVCLCIDTAYFLMRFGVICWDTSYKEWQSQVRRTGVQADN